MSNPSNLTKILNENHLETLQMDGNGGILPLDEAELYSAKLWNGGEIPENVQTAPFYILASAISDAGRIQA